MLRTLKTLTQRLLLLSAGSSFVLLCSACFNVEAPQTYRCSVAEPACPPGLICSAGLCVNKGVVDAASDLATDSIRDTGNEGTSKVDAAIDASIDAGIDASIDASIDAAPTPDLSGDLSPVPDAHNDASPPDATPDALIDTAT